MLSGGMGELEVKVEARGGGGKGRTDGGRDGERESIPEPLSPYSAPPHPR